MLYVYQANGKATMGRTLAVLYRTIWPRFSTNPRNRSKSPEFGKNTTLIHTPQHIERADIC